MYIGNEPLYQSFVTDTFSGNGSTTAFTMSVAPANTPSVLIAISGVVQDPTTYGVSGTTLTFSAAPPTGTSNISVRYLGIPASNITTTSYRTVTEFTATASQTTFTPASYTPGFINVYQNGALLGSADYTATNGTTVVLAVGATVGDLVVIESFYVSSVLNAIPATSGSISSTYLAAGSVGTTQISSGAVTPTQLSTQAQYTGFKNRIINGAMVIDQRNSGASVTLPSTGGQYTLDRWAFASSSASKYSVQQNAGSVVPPTGFTNYLGVTSLAATTVTAGDYYFFEQKIEGYNIADLDFGTANAKTVTLSFWVRSSLTGTFGGALQAAASTRTYPFGYSIPVANTWTQISVTIAGDTAGTWLTTNGVGLQVFFGLGIGTTYSGTTGSWSTSNYISVTGATNVVSTNGATWYLTGVQLEVGSAATSFDYRPYGTELALCQRYFQINGGTSGFPFVQGAVNAANDTRASFPFPVSMRATPTTTIAGTWASTNINGVAAPALSALGTQGFVLQTYSTSAGGYYYYPNSADDIMTFSAEL